MEHQMEIMWKVFGILVITGLAYTLGFYLEKNLFRLRTQNPKNLRIFDFATYGLVAVLFLLKILGYEYSLLANIVAATALITAITAIVLTIKNGVKSWKFFIYLALATLAVIGYFVSELIKLG